MKKIVSAVKSWFQNKKHRTFTIVCAAAAALFVFLLMVMPQCERTQPIPTVTNTEPLVNGVVVRQDLVGSDMAVCDMTVSELSLMLVNNDKSVKGDFVLSLYQNDTLVQSWERKLDTLGGTHSFALAKPLSFSTSSPCYITAQVQAEGDSPLSLQVGVRSDEQGRCTFGERDLEGHALAYYLSFEDAACNSVNTLYTVLLAGLIVLLLMTAWLMIYSKWRIEVLLTVLVFVLGVFFMVAITPRSVPDEPHHYHTSYELSNYLLFRFDSLDKGDAADFDVTALPGHQNTAEGYLRVFSEFGEGSGSTGETITIPLPRKLSYFVEYLPQAAGVAIGRAFGRNMVTQYMLGRLCNLLFYTACVYFALKKLPRFKLQMGLIAMLPMALHQAASLSYDAFVNGMSFLLIGNILHFVFERDPVKLKDLVRIGIIGALLVPGKVVYAPILLMLFFIRKEQFGSMKKKLIAIGIIGLVCAVVLLAFQLPSMLEIGSRGETKLNHEGQYNYTLSDLLRNPFKAVGLFLNTLYALGYTWLRWGIGSTLSGLNLEIPMWIIIGFLLVLVLSTVSESKKTLALQKRDRLFTLGIAATVILLTMLSMTVGWTSNTSNLIQGVQGRYFLPIFPLLLLALCGNKTFELKRNIDRHLTFAAVTLNVMTIVNILNYTVVR